MARYLLTPSLHDSWRFYKLMESKEKSDFLNTLLKVKSPRTTNMEAGIRFENDVLAYTKEDWPNVPPLNTTYGRCVKEVGDMVKGGLWQERVMFDANLFGIDFLIYGKIDVLKRDWIYDIKRSDTYEVGKYTESVQHPIYMKGTGVNKFKYLIGDDESVYHEEYRMTDGMEAEMWASLRDLVSGIMDDADFKRAYMENWKAFGEAKKQVIPNDGPGRIFAAG